MVSEYFFRREEYWKPLPKIFHDVKFKWILHRSRTVVYVCTEGGSRNRAARRRKTNTKNIFGTSLPLLFFPLYVLLLCVVETNTTMSWNLLCFASPQNMCNVGNHVSNLEGIQRWLTATANLNYLFLNNVWRYWHDPILNAHFFELRTGPMCVSATWM